jgi:hypothetical protein
VIQDMSGNVVRVAVLMVVLVAAVLALLDLVKVTAEAAACLERANFELVSCSGPPAWWSIPAVLLVLIVVSIVLGRFLPHSPT